MSDVLWIEDRSEFQDLLDTEPVVVVDFSAPAWCIPCQRFAPHFDAASEKSDATFVAVDVDKADWAMVDFGVRGVPTVKLFKNGQFVTDLVKNPQDKTVIKLLNEISNA